MADPLMLDLNKECVLKYRPKPRPRPIEVIEMMKPHSRAKYMPTTPVEEPIHDGIGDDPDSEPDMVEPEPSGPASLMDILNAEAGDDDDDDELVFIVDEDQEIEGNSSKRRRTV